MKKLILFGISFFVTLIIIEIFFHLAKIEIPIDEVDPIIGRKKKNGVEFTRLEEGFFLGRINDQGYLGPSRPFKKDTNEIRIALLGDSYVQAQFTFDEYSHRAILQKELNKLMPNKEVFVLNFGMAGFGVQNMYAYYCTFAQKYNPDIVLFFLGDNSFYFNYKTLVPTIKIENDSIQVISDFQHGTLYKIYDRFPLLMNSSLVRMFYKIIRKKRFPADIVFGKFSTIFTKKSLDDSPLIQEEGIKSGRTDYKISSIDKKILATLNGKENVYFVLRNQPNKNLEYLIDTLNLKVIDLTPSLHKLLEKGIDPYYWEVTNIRGHWNHAGNKAVAEAIAEDLYKEIYFK